MGYSGIEGGMVWGQYANANGYVYGYANTNGYAYGYGDSDSYGDARDDYSSRPYRADRGL